MRGVLLLFWTVSGGYVFFFFFSSRRRHTRLQGDWSSDVCSSDLTGSGKFVRVLGWFAGGLWCYELARWALVLSGRNTSEMPPLLWGGVFFVGLEFVVHGLLQASGKPNFYSGQLRQSETTAAR